MIHQLNKKNGDGSASMIKAGTRGRKLFIRNVLESMFHLHNLIIKSLLAAKEKRGFHLHHQNLTSGRKDESKIVDGTAVL